MKIESTEKPELSLSRWLMRQKKVCASEIKSEEDTVSKKARLEKRSSIQVCVEGTLKSQNFQRCF